MMFPRTALWATASALLFGAGLGTGYLLYRPKPVPVEGYAPGQQLTPDTRLLPRDPGAKPFTPLAKVPGAKVERRIQVEVMPEVPTQPVKLDLELLRMPDGTHRVEAKAENSQIIGGVDVPVGPPVPASKTLRWNGQLLAEVGPSGARRTMVLVTYHRGPFTASMAHLLGPAGGTFVGGGIRF